MLAPRHPAVATLPRGYRTPLHLRAASHGWRKPSGSSAGSAGAESVTWHRSGRRTARHTWLSVSSSPTRTAPSSATEPLGERGGGGGRDRPGRHRERFIVTWVRAGLLPWWGRPPRGGREPSGRTQNKTEPVAGEILQPTLAAALHLVTVLGPHAVELDRHVRQADRVSSVKAEGPRHGAPTLVEDVRKLLERDYLIAGTALPMLEDHDVAKRIAAGWSADDPLLPVATGVLARQAGYSQLWARQLLALRGTLQNAVASVGAEKTFARNAAEAPAADNSSTLPWTLPLHRSQAVALVGIVRTAAIIVVAAASGMRASELMELRVGCRRPVEEPVPGLQRFRIASKVVKGQPLGGTDDEWVVIEPVYRAAELAEQLHDYPRDGVLMFGRFVFDCPLRVVQELGQLPGRAADRARPDPGRPGEPQDAEKNAGPGDGLPARRRPASKIHLKHVAVATTEGYASRPGGAQAELLSEVNKHESDRNLDLVLAEFRTTSRASCPPAPAPGASPSSSPPSTPAPTRPPRQRQRSSATTATSSTC